MPGKINFDSFKNSSGVIFAVVGNVTAIPGNFEVYVAAEDVRNEDNTRRLNWPVYTEFGMLDAEGHTQPCVVGCSRRK